MIGYIIAAVLAAVVVPGIVWFLVFLVSQAWHYGKYLETKRFTRSN